MQQPAKRRPGRPPQINKEAKQDIHLWLPDSLLNALDLAKGDESRTEFIIRLIRKRIDTAGAK